jgi:hypothetical protein
MPAPRERSPDNATGLVVPPQRAAVQVNIWRSGAADRPLARLEFSGNCNNPTYSLCQQVGLGGIWIWIEIDANNTGDIAGAGCGHVRGVGGGAGSIRGDITWTYTTFAGASGAGAFILGIDPGNQYYLVPLCWCRKPSLRRDLSL